MCVCVCGCVYYIYDDSWHQQAAGSMAVMMVTTAAGTAYHHWRITMLMIDIASLYIPSYIICLSWALWSSNDDMPCRAYIYPFPISNQDSHNAHQLLHVMTSLQTAQHGRNSASHTSCTAWHLLFISQRKNSNGISLLQHGKLQLCLVLPQHHRSFWWVMSSKLQPVIVAATGRLPPPHATCLRLHPCCLPLVAPWHSATRSSQACSRRALWAWSDHAAGRAHTAQCHHTGHGARDMQNASVVLP